MLIPSISPIKNNKFQSDNAKNNEISHKTVNNMTLPSFADAKSLANINFKAAIHDYAAEGNWKGVKKELQKVNVNAQDVQGKTALMLAITHNRMNVAKKLLQNPDIDVNAQDKIGYTALNWAAYTGSVDLIRMLINHPDINVNILSRTGTTPLTLAAMGYHVDAVAEILRHPNVNVNLNHIPNAATHDANIIRHMIKAYVPGVDNRINIKQGQSQIQASQNVSDINAQDYLGNTVLIKACRESKIDEVEKLLQNPDIDVNAQDKIGYTALNWAAYTGSVDLIRMLINHPDINVNVQNRFNETALMCASAIDNADIVEKLLQHPDIDVNVKNKKGNTALIWASYRGGAKVVEKLLQNPDIDVNVQGQDGHNALMHASANGDKEIVEKLVKHPNIDVNAQDDFGNTALMQACYFKDESTVEVLLRHPGVDINLKDSYGKVALDYANDEIAQMIKDYVPGIDRRKDIIPKQIDIEKLTSFKEIWSDKEKQNITKMVENKDYDGLVTVFESKGKSLNKEYENFRNQMSQIKEAAEKSARKTETEKIREEEKIAAEEKVADKIAELDKSKAEYEEKNKALDNLINDYQAMLSDDIEDAKSGIRTLYGIKSNELPEKMDLGEQMIYVIDIMSNNRNKLSNMNSDSPEKITKALQDNNGQISADGLKFLERVIKVSDRSCSEDDLISSINAVKDKSRHIDMKKVSYFIANLSWGQSRISDVIQKVEQYDSKNN